MMGDGGDGWLAASVLKTVAAAPRCARRRALRCAHDACCVRLVPVAKHSTYLRAPLERLHRGRRRLALAAGVGVLVLEDAGLHRCGPLGRHGDGWQQLAPPLDPAPLRASRDMRVLLGDSESNVYYHRGVFWTCEVPWRGAWFLNGGLGLGRLGACTVLSAQCLAL